VKDRRTSIQRLEDAINRKAQRVITQRLLTLKEDDPQAYYEALTAFETRQGTPPDPMTLRYRASVVESRLRRRDQSHPVPA
jgi:hypothetical protein